MKKRPSRKVRRKRAEDQIVAVCVQSHKRLLAMRDLLAMLEASSFGGGKAYRCLTPAELGRLAEIRAEFLRAVAGAGGGAAQQEQEFLGKPAGFQQ
jgi:hypothetical protein